MLTVRLSETMFEELNNACKLARLTHGEYIRKLIRGKKIVIKQEIIADIPQLKRLIAEFGRISSNLNQIARHYNTGGINSPEIYKATQRAIAALFDMKFEVEKLGGEWAGHKRPYHRKDIQGTDKTAK